MNKHIKKYYFYYLGRFLDFFKQYELSAKAYAKVIKHRFFFADVQVRFAKAYEQSSGDNLIMVRGGIGDMLQSLPFMLAHPSAKYVVFTHFLRAEAFYQALGIKIHQFYFYSNLDEHKALNKQLFHSDEIYLCPRSVFMENSPFAARPSFFENSRPVVGLHFGASAIGSKKTLSVEFVQQLLNRLSALNLNLMVFCTKNELEFFKEIKVFETEQLKFACEEDVTKSLSLVAQCHAFLGSDSAFKTMSSMLSIPTMVLFEDDKNRFRDRTFINPYSKFGVMQVFKYKSLNADDVEKALAFVLASLKGIRLIA